MIRILYIACLLILSSSIDAQTLNWAKTYGGQGYDKGNSAVQLADSSYVIVGTSSSFYNSNQNILFLKVDSAGNFLYSNFLDNGLWDNGQKIIARNDGEFWICGHTNSIGAGGFDGYLTKVDSLGNKISDFTFGGSDWDFIHDMIMLSDSSLVLVGETQSYGLGNKDAYIIHTDKFGDTLWTKTIGSTKDDWASAITERNDTLYIAGAIGDDSNDTTYGLLLGLDLSGNTLFENKVAETDFQYFNDIHQYNAFNLYLVGGKQVNSQMMAYTDISDYQGNFTGGQYWFTADGNTAIKAITNYPGTFYMMNCIETNASSLSNYSPSVDMHIAKTTPGAYWNYGQIYGFQDDEEANDLIETIDNGVLAIGSNGDLATGGSNVFLIKVGAQDSFPSPLIDSLYPVHTSINELEIEDLEVYPNPTNGIIYFQIQDLNQENYQFQLISSEGKLIRNEELTQSMINISDFSKGLYFLRVWSDKKRFQTRIIKE